MPATCQANPDAVLVESLAAGDPSAMAALIEQHGRWVRGVVFGVLGDADEVEDVCQQVWLTLWRRCGELKDLRGLRNWLYRLARNVAIDAGRRKTVRRRLWQRVTGLFAQRRPGCHEPADKDVIRQEQHRHVLKAIGSIPEIYRQAFVMRHLEEMGYQEIAETLGVGVEAVETRLVRARRLLRKKLARKSVKP